MPEIIIIAAVANNGVIGKDNQLLWNIPEDTKHFREATAGQPVIMGRKTWESLPEKFRPLPGRRNIVITRQSDYAASGAELADSLETAVARCTEAERLFIIGGAEIYAQAMHCADTLLLTEVALSPEGDARFPEVSSSVWQEQQRYSCLSSTGIECAFVTYKRLRP